MKKYILAPLCVILSVVSIAQPKMKPAKNDVPSIQKLLAGTGLPVSMLNDSVAVIPYGGANIPSFNVLVRKISDLYIIYTDLSAVLPGKINESKYPYLLKINDEYDAIKVAITGEDHACYIRADLYKSAATTALMARLIKQVANVANIIAGDLK
jgi:PHD/YefM family antitoxin component YafN of YafNO toxin-antitoxin module